MLNGLFIMASILVIFTEFSNAQQPCYIEQVTFETIGQSSRPSISSDGFYIAFRSSANINGSNLEGNSEIYLYERLSRNITSVTNTDVGITNLDPSISSNGQLVVFTSNGDLSGNNSDGNEEVFLFNAASGNITQITNTDNGFNGRPVISNNGKIIAFESSSNISNGNPEGNTEIYIYNLDTGIFSQLTDQPTGDSMNVSINQDGNRIAFQSSADIGGSNINGNFEIYLADTTTNTLIQITDTVTGENTSPSIDGLGVRIAFIGRANINGGNADGSPEIFLYDLIADSFIQVTSTATIFESREPSLSGNGLILAFNSSASINGDGNEGTNQLYLFDIQSGKFTKVAQTTSGLTTNPDTDLNGVITAFQSAFNIVGDNPEGNVEIYVATCNLNSSAIKSIPTLSEAALFTFALSIIIIALIFLVRGRLLQ